MTTPSTGAVDCQAVVRALWDYLDGRLAGTEMEAIAVHLQGCFGCRSHAEFEQTLLQQIARTRPESGDLSALDQRVRAALAAGAAAKPDER